MREPNDLYIWQALARLESTSKDFKLFTRWLGACLEEQRNLNDSTIGEIQLRQGQGAAQTLTTILSSVAKARKTVNDWSETERRSAAAKEARLLQLGPPTGKAASFGRTV